MHWGSLLVYVLPLDESQIARAAEEMIAEYGNEALGRADKRINALKSESFDSFVKTWELIREAIKDVQKSDKKVRLYESSPSVRSEKS